MGARNRELWNLIVVGLLMSAGFAISDGWNENPANRIHRLAPLIAGKPNTASNKKTVVPTTPYTIHDF